MGPKILLIQLRQLGDILLCTACIREIKQAWPDATISFLCHPMGRLVLEDNPYLHKIWSYAPQGSWWQDLQLMKELRAEGFELVLDFMYNPRSALYAKLTGAPRRLAFPSRRSWLFTEPVAQASTVEYIVEEKFRYLRALGIAPNSHKLDLPWFKEDAALVCQFLRETPSFATAALRVVLSPTHRRVERQWSLSSYAAIADRLTLEWGAAVLWIWGPGEKEVVLEVQQLCRQLTYVAPQTSFRQVAAFVAQCDLFMGNSNGPSHVAVAVQTPSLQLHGPTYAAAWSPLNDRHRAIQAAQDSSLGRGAINEISPDKVWQTLLKMQKTLFKSAQLRPQNGVRMDWLATFNERSAAGE